MLVFIEKTGGLKIEKLVSFNQTLGCLRKSPTSRELNETKPDVTSRAAKSQTFSLEKKMKVEWNLGDAD